MAEELEDEEETKKASSPPLPPSPRNRLLSTPKCRKNSGDLPGLSSCHSCGLYYPTKAQIDKLQTLDSQWRVVILCKSCIGRVRSAEACSYCFSMISDEDGDLLDCRECSSRVHLRCAPMERGYVDLAELHPDSFTCIDCCALPKFHRRNPSAVGARFSLEDLVRDASSAAEKKAVAAARAKEKAQQKALAAKRAAELARDALDAVVVDNESSPNSNLVAPDEELALQLHRVINGSQRVSRTRRSISLDCAIGSKKVRASGNLACRKAESCSNSVCEKVEFCTEDKVFFSSMEKVLLNPSSSLELDAPEKNYQVDRHSGNNGSSLVEIPVKEEQMSCYNESVEKVLERIPLNRNRRRDVLHMATIRKNIAKCTRA